MLNLHEIVFPSCYGLIQDSSMHVAKRIIFFLNFSGRYFIAFGE